MIGLNVVVERRRGLTKADIHGFRQVYEDDVLRCGYFRERVDEVAAHNGRDPLGGKAITFIRAGARPLIMAVRRAETSRDA